MPLLENKLDSTLYIDQIEKKIDAIISENSSLKGKLDLAQSERDQVILDFDQSREKIKILENQIKINNIAKGNLEGGKDTKEMRDRLNEVIREVDRCIRYLKG